MKLSLSWVWIGVLGLVGSLPGPCFPANVTLTSFTTEASTDSVTVKWETATELNNLGFYLWRSEELNSDYADISGYIPSSDEGAGASYEYEDVDVTSDVTYYYKLQEIPDDGATGVFTGPISVTVPVTTYVFLPAVQQGWFPPPVRK